MGDSLELLAEGLAKQGEGVSFYVKYSKCQYMSFRGGSWRLDVPRRAIPNYFSTPSSTNTPHISSGPMQMPATSLKIRHRSVSTSRIARLLCTQQAFNFSRQV